MFSELSLLREETVWRTPNGHAPHYSATIVPLLQEATSNCHFCRLLLRPPANPLCSIGSETEVIDLTLQIVGIVGRTTHSCRAGNSFSLCRRGGKEGVGMPYQRPKTIMRAKVTSARPITERAIVRFWFLQLLFKSAGMFAMFVNI